MAKQFTLGKNERLKSRKQIEQLFKDGKNFNLIPFRVYYSFSQLQSHDADASVGIPAGFAASGFTTQFGVGVSAKNFKRAVDRNRIKRLVREAYRLQNLSLKEKLKLKNLQLNVFFIYTGKEVPGFNFIKEKLAVALKKLEMIGDENNSSNS